MFVKLTTIVGKYSASIVENTLWGYSIDYEKNAGQYDTWDFSVKDTDRDKAMKLIEKAMSDELERLANK